MADNTKLQVTALPGGVNPTTVDAAPRPRVTLKVRAARRVVLKLKARRA